METAELTTGASASYGLFALPAISQEIPARIEEASERSRLLARFALASEAQGLALPGGNFTRLEDVVAQQWSDHLHSISDRIGETLLGSPNVIVSDEHLTVLIGARSGIETFVLKPMVEALEDVLTGLGWFVVDVLSSARCSGLFFYDMTMVAYHLDHRLCDLDEFTDQAYARAILQEEGQREWDDETEIPPEKLEEMRESYLHWPSQILDAVGGHFNLLGLGGMGINKRAARKPIKPLSVAQVNKWLKVQDAGSTLTQCVQAALALQKALAAKDAPDFTFYTGEDDVESVGAMCFLAWDDPSLLWDAASHSEEYAYNGGDVIEAFARKTYSLTNGISDQQLAQLVKETKEFLNQWHLLEKLVSHFPIARDDDEI